MVEAAQGGSPDQATAAQWKQKYRIEREFRERAIVSYLWLCFGIGVVALALPVLLLVFGTGGPHHSISHYYHGGDNARNILVGSLWATGVFMFLYQGLSWAENWTLNIGGLAAISVAMNPVGVEKVRASFGLHEASAITFFACLALVAVVFARRRLEHIIHPPYRRLFARAYAVAGVVMIGMPAVIAFLEWPRVGAVQSDWIFWIESFGIWAFAFYWFVKTVEYRMLVRLSGRRLARNRVARIAA